ncbi:MAG TPA: putative Na+/H+ antiporter [Rhabdochlamydiaceae bacterium]|nr:putative Na+/H+ antiporter [Rhabdochlamydiaceae bacterium]
MDPVLATETPSTFRILTLIIFILAILHTLFANHFVTLANHVEALYARKHKKEKPSKRISFMAEILRFLGEIEIVFAFWAIPLMIVILSFYDWKTALNYLNSRIYEEPFFIVIIMSLASTRPIFQFAEKATHFIAKRFGDTPGAWWLTIMTLSPLLGSIITEAAAMTIGALILKKRFYECGVSRKLAYGTLGLMFVNFSVGGVLTNFAAPPSVILTNCYHWTAADFFRQFGVKTLVGIVMVNLLYFFIFRDEFKKLKKFKPEVQLGIKKEERVPFWITCINLAFISWVILMKEYSAIFIGSYLLFLGFHHATRPYQDQITLRKPLMVGLFLAGLMIHVEFQKWWIERLLTHLNYGQMMITGLIVTAFSENSVLAQLSCLIPDLTALLKYALVAGFIAGGGLTVIAHAPNLVGQTILKKYFRHGVSPLYLFLGALGPTLVFFVIYYFFPPM